MFSVCVCVLSVFSLCVLSVCSLCVLSVCSLCVLSVFSLCVLSVCGGPGVDFGRILVSFWDVFGPPLGALGHFSLRLAFEILQGFSEDSLRYAKVC